MNLDVHSPQGYSHIMLLYRPKVCISHFFNDIPMRGRNNYVKIVFYNLVKFQVSIKMVSLSP